MATRNRLKNELFKNGACLDESAYAEVFDSTINFEDDGVERPTGNNPLKIKAKNNPLALVIKGDLHIDEGRVGIGVKPINSKLEIKSSGDQDQLLRFHMDRPWHFRQTGSEASTSLELRSEVDWKVFSIANKTGVPIAKFLAGDTTTNKIQNQVLLIPDGNGKVGIGTNNPSSILHISGNLEISKFPNTLSTPKIFGDGETGLIISAQPDGNHGSRIILRSKDYINSNGGKEFGRMYLLFGDETKEEPVQGAVMSFQFRYKETGQNNVLSRELFKLESNKAIFHSPIELPSSGTLMYANTNESGVPKNDGFRIRYEPNFLDIQNFDALVIEKTDGNQSAPDGCIAFVNHGIDAATKETREVTSMVIRGNGRVGIGTTDPQKTLHLVGDMKIEGNLIVDSLITQDEFKPFELSITRYWKEGKELVAINEDYSPHLNILNKFLTYGELKVEYPTPDKLPSNLILNHISYQKDKSNRVQLSGYIHNINLNLPFTGTRNNETKYFSYIIGNLPKPKAYKNRDDSLCFYLPVIEYNCYDHNPYTKFKGWLRVRVEGSGDVRIHATEGAFYEDPFPGFYRIFFDSISYVSE